MNENESRAAQTENLMDYRTIPQAISEVRAVTTEQGATRIEGHGIVFNVPSQRMALQSGYTFTEYIDSRATDEVDFADTVAFFNHDPNFILGSRSNGTIDFTKSGQSVSYSITPPDTQLIRDLVIAPITRGDVKGSSFMFNIGQGDDEWEYDHNTKTAKRYIKRISEVFEVGPVSMPAYKQSTSQITLRSFDAFLQAFEQEQQAAAVHYRRLIAERRVRLRK